MRISPHPLVCLAGMVLWLLLSGPVWAQNAGGQGGKQFFPEIEQARQALNAAERAMHNIDTDQTKLAALGQAVNAYEAALAAFRSGLRAMAAREAAMHQALEADQSRVADLLVALQTASRAPDWGIIAFPGGPVAAVRGASMMADITPALRIRAQDLENRLRDIAALRMRQNAARIEARGALAALQSLRTQTAHALHARGKVATTTNAALEKQSRQIRQNIRDLDALSDVLDKALPSLPRTGSDGSDIRFDEARGLLALPVQGELHAGFGGPDPWNRTGQGLNLRAPAYAQVSAPWSGVIRYAGPLTGYGQVVIIEPQQGYLLILAGLGHIDRAAGETVLRDEKLGDMGGPLPSSDDFLLEANADDAQNTQEMLYLELRHDGQPVDPATWFDLTDREAPK